MNDSLSIEPYAAQNGPAWDELVRRAKNGHFLFERGFMEYHRERFQDQSYVWRRDGAVVAVLPANRNGSSLVSHGGLTFGGLVLDPLLRITDVRMAFSQLAHEAQSSGVKKFVYKALPSMYSSQPAEEDRYALHAMGARLVRRDLTTTIRLAEPVPLNSARRRGVRKAEDAGVKVLESSTLKDYWEVLTTNLRDVHGKAPVHTLSEIELLRSRFPKNIRLFQAERNGEVLAGIVVFETATVAHAQYIASSAAGRSCGALDLVFEHAIRSYTRTHGYFDFGISTEDNGRMLNEGLVQFKESFGGRSFVHDFYEVDL